MNIEAPVRSSWSYTQTLVGTRAQVFPLLCPVREADWIPSWSPRLVVSKSGLVEPGCAFVTADEERQATWYVVDHEPESFRVRMIKVEPDHVATELTISLREISSGCLADVEYTYTALGESGKIFVQGRDRIWWTGFMESWESLLNAYLKNEGD